MKKGQKLVKVGMRWLWETKRGVRSEPSAKLLKRYGRKVRAKKAKKKRMGRK